MPTAFPKSPIRRIGPPGPMSRVHSSMQTGKLLRLLGQIYRSRARQTCKSCMRLHKRELRLGRGAGSASRPQWTAVCSGKCLPPLVCCDSVRFAFSCAALRYIWPDLWAFLGVGGERIHWHGELGPVELHASVKMRDVGLVSCDRDVCVVRLCGTHERTCFGSNGFAAVWMLGCACCGDRSAWRARCLVLV